MPNEDSHITLAIHNQKVIDYLIKDSEEYSDWITTVAFYKALHIIEAIFFKDKVIGHGHSHEDRERFLKNNKKYSHIFKNYRPLWAASMIARYLDNPSKRGVVYTNFSDFQTPDKVTSEIIGSALRD